MDREGQATSSRQVARQLAGCLAVSGRHFSQFTAKREMVAGRGGDETGHSMAAGSPLHCVLSAARLLSVVARSLLVDSRLACSIGKGGRASLRWRMARMHSRCTRRGSALQQTCVRCAEAQERSSHRRWEITARKAPKARRLPPAAQPMVHM